MEVVPALGFASEEEVSRECRCTSQNWCQFCMYSHAPCSIHSLSGGGRFLQSPKALRALAAPPSHPVLVARIPYPPQESSIYLAALVFRQPLRRLCLKPAENAKSRHQRGAAAVNRGCPIQYPQ